MAGGERKTLTVSMKAACLNLSVSVISADENDVFPFTSLFIGVRKYGRFMRESQSGSRAQVAAMLPVCIMYDHLDRYKA